MKASVTDYLSFTGRCGIEHGAPGHWNEDLPFTLHANSKGTRFWYEASCAPGKPQPVTRIHGRDEVLRALAAFELIKELRGHLVQPELTA